MEAVTTRGDHDVGASLARDFDPEFASKARSYKFGQTKVMFLIEVIPGVNSEEPGVIPLFKTFFDRMSKEEHHRDVPARERVLKRGMAHGSARRAELRLKPQQNRGHGPLLQKELIASKARSYKFVDQ